MTSTACATISPRFESFEDGFRSILFDKTGIHAQKGNRPENTETMMATDVLNADIVMLDERIRRDQAELEEINGMIMRIEKDLSRDENEKEWLEKHIKSLQLQIRDVEKQIENFREEMLRSEKAIENYQNEIQEWESRLIEFNERSESLKKNIAEFTEKREDIDRRILDRRDLSKKDAENLKKTSDRISELEKSLLEIIFKINGIEEHLWVEYEKKISELKGFTVDESMLPEIQKNIQDLKKDTGPRPDKQPRH